MASEKQLLYNKIFVHGWRRAYRTDDCKLHNKLSLKHKFVWYWANHEEKHFVTIKFKIIAVINYDNGSVIKWEIKFFLIKITIKQLLTQQTDFSKKSAPNRRLFSESRVKKILPPKCDEESGSYSIALSTSNVQSVSMYVQTLPSSIQVSVPLRSRNHCQSKNFCVVKEGRNF